MKVVIAPMCFKGTFSSMEVAEAIRAGLSPNTEAVLMPIADGGDETLDVLIRHFHGTIEIMKAEGPYGKEVKVPWGYYNQTAVIEIAKVCGLNLTKERNPLLASTYGLGQVLNFILAKGYKKIIIGLGGSATNDGGAGMLQALGFKLLDKDGRELPRGAIYLNKLAHIELKKFNHQIVLQVACDVSNPLLGPNGATQVYGEQKGATPQMLKQLEDNLAHFASIVQKETGIDIGHLPKGGAAGGTAASLHAFLQGQLCTGIDLILDNLRFDAAIKNADLIYTGEGRMDAQTLNDKGPIGIAKRAKKLGIPVYAIVGSLGPGYEKVRERGISKIIEASTLEEITKAVSL